MQNIKKEAITVIRSRRKTLSIEIKPSGIIVRAPWHMSQGEINKFLKEKEGWIKKHLSRMEERQDVTKDVEPLSEAQIKSLKEKAKLVIPEKVAHYAPLVGVDYGRITIRCQRTCWGSCSSQGNLNFNCLLMLLPDEVIDSVVVHELCHRKQMNHSEAFYNEVYKVFPEYKRCRQWLKENGGKVMRKIYDSAEDFAEENLEYFAGGPFDDWKEENNIKLIMGES